jgi:hypothetical protein
MTTRNRSRDRTHRDDFPPRIELAIKRAVKRAITGAVERAYPVGSFFVSAMPTNPAVQLGFGTWSPVLGRVLVGIDPTQVEFDTVLETGGAKTHVLTVAETPCAC